STRTGSAGTGSCSRRRRLGGSRPRSSGRRSTSTRRSSLPRASSMGRQPRPWSGCSWADGGVAPATVLTLLPGPAGVSARLPWETAQATTPDPVGPDALHAICYRAAVAGADVYRFLRIALRRERGILRVGNRFVADGRYREVAFVAVGHAANSMALAALDVFGERLTQGYL